MPRPAGRGKNAGARRAVMDRTGVGVRGRRRRHVGEALCVNERSRDGGRRRRGTRLMSRLCHGRCTIEPSRADWLDRMDHKTLQMRPQRYPAPSCGTPTSGSGPCVRKDVEVQVLSSASTKGPLRRAFLVEARPPGGASRCSGAGHGRVAPIDCGIPHEPSGGGGRWNVAILAGTAMFTADVRC